MCWMKRFKYIGCIAFVLTCFAANSSASETVVAIVYNEPAEENFDGTSLAEVFKEELRALTSGEFDLRFKAFPAQWDTEATTQTLDVAYADSIVDMVLVVGFLGNQIAVSRATFTKPTFLPMVINAELMGAPTDGNRSGKRNLSYLVDSVPFKDNITTFRRLVPFNRLVLLLDSAGLEVLVRAPALLSQQVPDISVMFIGHDISQGESLAIDIPDSAEAVILGGLPRLNQEQLTEVLRSFADRGIPVFSQSEHEVHSGALASFAIDTDYIRIARRNALNMQAVLLGQKAEDQRIYYEGRRKRSVLGGWRVVGWRFSPFRRLHVKGFVESTRSLGLAVERTFPVFAQGPQPDGFFRLVVFLVPVVPSASLGDADMGPSGGLVGDASEARRLHERFDQQGRDVIAHGPVLDQLSAHDGQDVRGEVGDAYPGQDEETGVVDDLGEILLSQCRRPADEPVARGQFACRGGEPEQGQ